MINLKTYCFAAALIAAMSWCATLSSLGQGLDLITNGDFAATGTGTYGAGINSTAQSYTTGATVTGWTNTGYTFVFTGNAGDQSITGSGGAFNLWGPANGTANGLSLPTGYTGNIIAADGAYEVGPIQQNVSGLTAGLTYQLTFQYAGAQQQGYNGNTTEGWSVALSSASNVFTQAPGGGSGTLAGGQNTTVLNNVSNGFTGWSTATLDFTATGATETLYFLADGTPSGEPPFALLADVKLVAVPEPGTTAACMILFAMAVMGGTRAWRRFATKPAANS